MKRDMDLIRALLTQIEDSDSVHLDTYTKEQILYHKNLLLEANLVHGKTLHGDDQILVVMIDRLTWEGHEFLDAIRDENIWQQTKDSVEKISGAPIVIIKEVAINIARTTINAHTEGGSYIGGNVNAGDSFIGRDQR